MEKKVIIIGNPKPSKRLDYWCRYFHENRYEILDSPTTNPNYDIYTYFYESIPNADMIFIMNEDNGEILSKDLSDIYFIITSYFGRKNIQILNMPKEYIDCYDIITSWIESSYIKLFEFNLLYELNSYTPFNEQEEKDLSLFFKYINLHRELYTSPIDALLTRENALAHFSGSAFVLNKSKNKMLVVHHNILDSWIYPGGHADGESNLLSVAIREVEEETGLKAKALDNSIFSIQANPVGGHIKNGEYVSSHIHFDVIFLLEADDSRPLTYRKEESKGVKWITFKEATDEKSIDKQILPIHSKLISKFELMAEKFRQDEKYKYETITHHYQSI